LIEDIQALEHKNPSSLLVKQHLAAALREQITSGAIPPGAYIVEGEWAARHGVAQGSVREAINILIAEGFVKKVPGRRARVIQFSCDDVAQVYEFRASFEALAARLITEKKPDLTPLDRAVIEMEAAAAAGNSRALVESDLRFHLLLCELSGNRFVFQEARRLLVPLFAFVLMRVETNRQGSEPWRQSLKLHSQIIDIIRMGDPALAAHFVERTTHEFGSRAYQAWEKTTDHGPACQ
jgi:DNA-binding GntR family transcriptional regulator